MPDPIKPTAADYEQAAAETNRLQRELDITNADHIALWLEVNTIPDEPMDQCISWLACRLVEAHEAAAQQARDQALEDAAPDDRYPYVYHDRETWGRIGVSYARRTDFIEVTMLLENKPGGRWQVVDMTPDEAEQLGRRLIERATTARRALKEQPPC